jgi:hypothetical protein
MDADTGEIFSLPQSFILMATHKKTGPQKVRFLIPQTNAASNLPSADRLLVTFRQGPSQDHVTGCMFIDADGQRPGADPAAAQGGKAVAARRIPDAR